MERFDVVVIGAGPAGSAAALCLARRKLNVLLVERGKSVGQKNVFGGRIYSYPLHDLIPDWQKDCPVERYVTHDVFAFTTEDQALQVHFDSPRLGSGKAASFVALRSKFDAWLAQKAEAAGAMLVTGTRIDDLWLENGRVKGVIEHGDRVAADVVIAADGVVSGFTQKLGLRGEMVPPMVSVGIKETIELPPATIQDRFNLDEKSGAAYVIAGHATRGMRGGGFLYTNKDSISVGLVVSSEDVSRHKVDVPSLQEGFKRHPMLAKLLAGGKSMEYSTHMIPELGSRTLSRAYADGLLVAGDAAGFLINNGYTFRGVDLAIASGMAAAEAASSAKTRNDSSASSLAAYEQLLEKNNVLTDLRTFKGGPRYMANPRLFALYPKLACDLLERVFTVEGGGKQRILETVLDELKENDVSLLSMLRDLIGGAKSM